MFTDSPTNTIDLELVCKEEWANILASLCERDRDMHKRPSSANTIKCVCMK